MHKDQRVRFVTGSRFNDWQKGDFGVITKVLVKQPQNLRDIYLVEVRGKEVWATNEDIIAFNQMELF